MTETASGGPDMPAPAPSETGSDSATSVIRRYYACFNERRFVDATALLCDDAVLEQLPVKQQERGPNGYLQFVSAWLTAFPDAMVTVHGITTVNGQTFDVSLSLCGTHRGALDLDGWVFKPTGVHATFELRELMELQQGRIAYSTLTYDPHQIVDQLARVDVTKLLDHIARMSELAKALRAAVRDSAKARELTRRIGAELDAARQIARPYYAPRAKPSV